jgi:homoserine kinase
MAEWAIRVPGSSANLGAGFDVLGMAIGVFADVGCGDPPADGRVADEHHPATIAFRLAGGDGHLWTRTAIPMGRGLGYSGAVRVGGAAAALVQRHGPSALTAVDHRRTVLDVAARLERHADNAAASLEGGIVVVAGETVTRVRLAFDPAVVVWIPDRTTTSTDRSRTSLSDTVPRADAVFNLGRVATFVAACALGDPSRLRTATEDRLHQPARLAAVPRSAAALDAALGAGAWAAWLSGSGPTVAAMCEPAGAAALAAALPADGHAKILRIDQKGALVTRVDTEP